MFGGFRGNGRILKLIIFKIKINDFFVHLLLGPKKPEVGPNKFRGGGELEH